MSAIEFLASSKPIILPEEIECYHTDSLYETEMDFSVLKMDKSWCNIINRVLSMPYVYEARGLGSRSFFIYLDKYMDIGDVIELYTMPVQHWHEEYIQRVLENPEHITINAGRHTYENQYGIFQLSPKNWAEELSHRTLVTERGVTTILKF